MVYQETTMPKVELKPLETREELGQAKDWILNQHYIRRWPTAVQAKLGVYIDGKLDGVLLYGATIRPTAAREIFKNDDGTPAMQNNQTWELLRAYTTPEAKQAVPNLGSMAIAQGNEFIRTKAKTTDGKPVRSVLTYADSDVGHAGGVYKATNATYLGKQRPLPVFIVKNPETGDTYEARTMTRKAKEKLEGMGLQVSARKGAGKHKYVYALGKDQNDRDQLLSKIAVPVFDYPRPGEEPRQIENPAKARVSAKPKAQQPTPQAPESKQGMIKKLLSSKVKNPETGNDILVRTALRYDKTHPSYRQAMGMVNAYAKRYGIKLRTNR
jgi:hypothetical protein